MSFKILDCDTMKNDILRPIEEPRMVSILLATRDRPQYLREALESIQRQTARRAIAQVVVSENGSNDESKEVCARFNDLPITYVKQKPPVPAIQHLKVMWEMVRCPVVAILHDDDWWAPEHLETALAALVADRDCVAVYTNWYETFGPHSPFWIPEVAWMTWMAAGCVFKDQAAYLDQENTMLTCLLNASLHYSTVVGRSEPMRDALLRNVARNNDFDNDRTFPVFLSLHGSVGYIPAPSAFVRQHALRDAWRPEIIYRHFDIANETTLFLWNNYRELVSRSVEIFNQRLRKLEFQESQAVWSTLNHRVGGAHLTTLVRQCGLELERLLPQSGPPSNSFKNFIKRLCPPMLWEYAKRLRTRLHIGNGGEWQQEILRWRAKEVSRAKKC
jgi:glycosyltransferase involved in cell wall biosynthesis